MDQSFNLPEILRLHGLWLAGNAAGRRANLSGANLSNATLSGANLSYATLSGANLSYATLSGANLSYATLSGANLSGANLSDANLSNANLSDANLSNANLSRATLSDATLSRAEGLTIASNAPQRLRAVAAAALASPQSLNMSEWHTCDTAHCIAGWAIFQAGDVGLLLESAVGPEIAGLMLLGVEAHAHFHSSNDAARAWLQSVLDRPEAEA